MNKIVFIAGSQHSGTTLLNIILGGHSRLVGLGEVFQLLERKSEGFFLTEKLGDDCSCGASVSECPFWGKVSTRLHAMPAGDIDQRYGIVREVFMELFGPDMILVDSSKSLSYLELLADTPDIDLGVIHMTKDARAHCISQIDDATRKDKKYSKRNPFGQMRKWYRNNLAISRLLDTQQLMSFRLGYEELSLYPDKLVPALSDWLQLDYEPRMLELSPRQSHVVHGNRMREQEDKNRRIRYDNRWFYRSEWLLPFLLSARTRRLNARLVYHNETGHLWNQ
jgi:hypothetical protein